MGTFLQLPAALQEYADQRVWVLWKYKKLKSGKYTKPPYQPNDKKAKPNDPSTWVTFAEALAAYERGGFDGIGICLLNIDLGGFDCDDCRNAETGALEPAAQRLIERASTYVEITPSKTGLRILGKGTSGELHRKQPVSGANGMSVETYRNCARYITITGDALPGVNGTCADIDALMDEVVAALDAQKEGEGGGDGGSDNEPEPEPKPGPKRQRKPTRDDLDDIIKNGGQGFFRNKADGTVDRNIAVWWVINRLLERGDSDDEIVAILLNPDNKIGDHFRDHPQGAEITARRHVKEAREKLAVLQKGKEEQILAELNNQNAVAIDGGKTVVLRFERMEHSAGGERYTYLEPTFLSFSDFRKFYLNRRIQVGRKWIDIGKWWLGHPRRRQYRGLTFEPGGAKVIDGRFNLWRGWGAKPQPGDWSLMREHIRIVLCAGDEAFFDYVIRWIAWMVQYPGQQAEVATVFIGKRGTGKGTLGKALCRIFGQHQLHLSSPGQFTGRFNEHLRQCSFLFADEAYGPKDRTAEGELKRNITDDTISIEPKGRARFEVPYCLHVMIASNNDWVIPAGESERRFAAQEVSEIHLQDRAWFGPLYKQLREGGYAAMLHDLLQMDLGDWHPRDNVIRTPALAEQQEESLDAFDEWWLELLQTAVLPGAHPSDPSCPVSNEYVMKVTRKDPYGKVGDHQLTEKRKGLYDAARISSPRLRHKSDAAFGRYLSKRKCTPWRPQRRRGWAFPPLSECRADWLKRFPGTVWRDQTLTEWLEEPEEE